MNADPTSGVYRLMRTGMVPPSHDDWMPSLFTHNSVVFNPAPGGHGQGVGAPLGSLHSGNPNGNLANTLARVGQSGGGEKKEGRDLFSAVQKKLDKAKVDESSD